MAIRFAISFIRQVAALISAEVCALQPSPVILYAVVYRADMAPTAAIFCIGSESKPIPKLPGKFSTLARSFVCSCMIRDPAKRPSASQLLRHSFTVSRRRTGRTNRRTWPRLPHDCQHSSIADKNWKIVVIWAHSHSKRRLLSACAFRSRSRTCLGDFFWNIIEQFSWVSFFMPPITHISTGIKFWSLSRETVDRSVTSTVTRNDCNTRMWNLRWGRGGSSPKIPWGGITPSDPLSPSPFYPFSETEKNTKSI